MEKTMIFSNYAKKALLKNLMLISFKNAYQFTNRNIPNVV